MPLKNDTNDSYLKYASAYNSRQSCQLFPIRGRCRITKNQTFRVFYSNRQFLAPQRHVLSPFKPKKSEMAESSVVEDSELVDDEMTLYKKNALNVVSFRIVRGEEDLQGPSKKSNSFKPDMAHQVFGPTEMIFGYKKVAVTMFYLHNSAKCYVDVQASEKIVETDVYLADDIMKSMDPWIPEDRTLDKEVFLEELAKEDHGVIFGELLEEFTGSDNKTYKITLCDLQNQEFCKLHRRFETFIVWFIDGALYIDLEDPRWNIFYVYEEYVDPKTGETHHSPVGFCTVYRFFLYPESTRTRISQFFVLPTHQKRGIGTKLYSVIFNYLRELQDTADITVEEPTPVFQKIRDFCDSWYVYNELEDDNLNLRTMNEKRINYFLKRHKICKRQSQRVFDILECLESQKNGHKEYVKYTESIKARIAKEIERGCIGSKRLCSMQGSSDAGEPLDKKAIIDAEYSKYMDSLKSPINRMKSYLAKQ